MSELARGTAKDHTSSPPASRQHEFPMAVVLLRIRKLCVSVALCIAASLDHSAAVVAIRLPLPSPGDFCTGMAFGCNATKKPTVLDAFSEQGRVTSKDWFQGVSCKVWLLRDGISPVQWTLIYRDWPCMTDRNA
jgi:hypothetical protein